MKGCILYVIVSVILWTGIAVSASIWVFPYVDPTLTKDDLFVCNFVCGVLCGILAIRTAIISCDARQAILDKRWTKAYEQKYASERREFRKLLRDLNSQK